MDSARAPFGRLLRQARGSAGLTQLALALEAGVSTRHLSWLETGRAAPSRAMVLRLAERLAVPLRERNQWLAAAGYAPLFAERRLSDPALAPALGALQRLIRAHEPWPALVVDRHWHLVAHNAPVALLLALVPPALREPPVNVLRLSLHPEGLAPMIEGLGAWRAHVLERLARQARASGDPVLLRLRDELRLQAADDAARPPGERDEPEEPALIVPLVLRTPWGRLSFLTTVTVFGAPNDLTLSELAIETLLPADEATASTLRALAAEATSAT
jgi:transcriptional regulator with XRE-family HTH domain